MAFTNAEKQARWRARQAAELKALRKLAAKVQAPKANAAKAKKAPAKKRG
ncbi:hypothetical protein [Bradyrhizobium sp. McL0615]